MISDNHNNLFFELLELLILGQSAAKFRILTFKHNSKKVQRLSRKRVHILIWKWKITYKNENL